MDNGWDPFDGLSSQDSHNGIVTVHWLACDARPDVVGCDIIARPVVSSYDHTYTNMFL